jgi:hypothetical protein
MQTRKHAIPVWMRNEEKIKQQKAEFVTLYAKKSAFFKHKINLSLRQTAKLSSFCEIKKKKSFSFLQETPSNAKMDNNTSEAFFTR